MQMPNGVTQNNAAAVYTLPAVAGKRYQLYSIVAGYSGAVGAGGGILTVSWTDPVSSTVYIDTYYTPSSGMLAISRLAPQIFPVGAAVTFTLSASGAAGVYGSIPSQDALLTQ